jgi:hypothetical protein
VTAAGGADAEDEVGGGRRRGSPEKGLLGVELLGEGLELLDDGVQVVYGDALPGGVFLVEGVQDAAAGALPGVAGDSGVGLERVEGVRQTGGVAEGEPEQGGHAGDVRRTIEGSEGSERSNDRD